MSFEVKIFGTPTGFEVYNGTEQDANYFQIFDRKSKETVKMVIVHHRDKISCNYLRYGFYTSQGRDSGKFGLSVIFHENFCYAFKELYQRFERVYNTLEKHGILLKNNKFKISSFSDNDNGVTSELQNIERSVTDYITGNLADQFQPIPPLSPNHREDIIFLLSTKADNKCIADAVNQYYMVSISPENDNDNSDNGESGSPDGGECKADTVLIAKMKLTEKSEDLGAKSEEIKTRVINFQSAYISCLNKGEKTNSLSDDYESIKSDLTQFGIEISNCLNNVENFLKTASEKKTNLQGVKKKLEDEKKNIANLIENLKNTCGQSFGGKSDSNKLGKLITAVAGFIRQNKNKIVALFVVMLLLAVGCFILVHFWPKETSSVEGDLPVEEPGKEKPSSIINIDSLSSSALKKYQERDYVGAYKDYKTAGKAEAAKECQAKFKEICLSIAKTKKNQKEALGYFTENMKNVDYSPSQKDKADIENVYLVSKPAGKGNGGTNDKPLVTKEIKGTIRLSGEGVKSNDTVIWGKDFILHFACSENCDSFKNSDIKWKRNDVEIGSGNDFQDKVPKFNQEYKYTCHVKDQQVATAKVKSSKE